MEYQNGSSPSTALSLNPWDLAKERYLASLEEGERALFNEATVENLYYKTANESRHERKHSKIAQKLQPLVAAIKDYGQALDVYTNISPLPLAPIWGSIRVLLVLAEKYNKYYSQICDVLSRIGDLLPRFKDYASIFDMDKYPRLYQCLVTAYLDIINLCLKFREILASQRRTSFQRIYKPLLQDAQYEDALENFRQHRKSVEKEAETCHMAIAVETRAIVLRNQKGMLLQHRQSLY
jgi:tetratricopeptide (TPR) repeat protein